MKKKYVAALGVTLAVSAVVAGYASQHQTFGVVSNVETEAQNTQGTASKKDMPKGRFEIVHGEIASIDENTITINVAKRGDDGDSELTGETKEITVSDDTVIREDMRGRMGQRPDGQKSGQVQDGQKPDGEPPEMPADGQRPDFDTNGGPGGQMPDGQPPEKPEDDDATGNTESGVPNGEPPMRPGNDNSKTGGMDKQQSTLTVSDLSKGDEIAVFYDEDGNLKFIEVCNDNAKTDNSKKAESKKTDSTDADDADDDDTI